MMAVGSRALPRHAMQPARAASDRGSPTRARAGRPPRHRPCGALAAFRGGRRDEPTGYGVALGGWHALAWLAEELREQSWREQRRGRERVAAQVQLSDGSHASGQCAGDGVVRQVQAQKARGADA